MTSLSPKVRSSLESENLLNLVHRHHAHAERVELQLIPAERHALHEAIAERGRARDLLAVLQRADCERVVAVGRLAAGIGAAIPREGLGARLLRAEVDGLDHLTGC